MPARGKVSLHPIHGNKDRIWCTDISRRLLRLSLVELGDIELFSDENQEYILAHSGFCTYYYCK